MKFFVNENVKIHQNREDSAWELCLVIDQSFLLRTYLFSKFYKSKEESNLDLCENIILINA